MVTRALMLPPVRGRAARCGLLGGLAFAVTPTPVTRPLGAHRQPPQTGPRPSTRAVRVDVATARATYRAADTVAVRLILTNTGPVPLEVHQDPPWYAVRLIVTGSNGQVLAPVDDPDDRAYRTGRPYQLRPHVPDTAEFKRQQWTGLQHWGYGPLPPGRYTITAVPLAVGYDMEVDTETVRSNRVTITVTPPRRPRSPRAGGGALPAPGH